PAGRQPNDHDAGRARPVDTGRRTQYPATLMSYRPSYRRAGGDAFARPELGRLLHAAVGGLGPRQPLGRGAAMDDRERLGALRAQMSNVCSMFALAMVMFDLTEEPEILRLAVSSVGTLGPYHTQGPYLVDEAGMHSSDGDDRIVAELIKLDGVDGAVGV